MGCTAWISRNICSAVSAIFFLAFSLRSGLCTKDISFCYDNKFCCRINKTFAQIPIRYHDLSCRQGRIQCFPVKRCHSLCIQVTAHTLRTRSGSRKNDNTITGLTPFFQIFDQKIIMFIIRTDRLYMQCITFIDFDLLWQCVQHGQINCSFLF